jgi:hypothetical protein
MSYDTDNEFAVGAVLTAVIMGFVSVAFSVSLVTAVPGAIGMTGGLWFTAGYVVRFYYRRKAKRASTE